MEENKKGKILDLSEHGTVNFEGQKYGELCLEGVEKVIFAKGANVNLNDVRRIPKGINFRKLGDVGLRKARLSGYDEVAFSVGANVNLSNISRGPRVLNVAMCVKCCLADSELHGTEQIIFRDEQQLIESKYNLNFPNAKERIVYDSDIEAFILADEYNKSDKNDFVFMMKMREDRSLG